MNEQWEKECAELRGELTALRVRLSDLEAATANSGIRFRNFARGLFSKRLVVVLLPILTLIAVSRAIYGEGTGDPLFIDSKGDVGIGTNTPQGFQVVLPESSKPSTPLPGVTIAGGLEGNASIELRNNGSGTPYIDFAQDKAADYNARIRLTAPGQLAFEGADVALGSNPILFSSIWRASTENSPNNAEISNDVSGYKSLMIVGNKSKDGKTRRVSVYDRLEVNGPLSAYDTEVNGSLKEKDVSGYLDVPLGFETLRMVRGTVTARGVKSGDGYVVKIVGEGLYDVTFLTPFAASPSASVTQVFDGGGQGGDTRDNAIIVSLAADRMRVKTGAGDGRAQNRDFSFVVMGLRNVSAAVGVAHRVNQ